MRVPPGDLANLDVRTAMAVARVLSDSHLTARCRSGGFDTGEPLSAERWVSCEEERPAHLERALTMLGGTPLGPSIGRLGTAVDARRFRAGPMGYGERGTCR